MTTKLRAASFQDNAVTTAKIAADAITNAKIADDAVQTENVASTVNLGRRNIMINGDMQVAQRGTSSTSTGFVTCDRFKTNKSGPDITTTQHALSTSDTPYSSGLRNSYQIHITDPQTPNAAVDYAEIAYTVESQDMAQSGWDYTSASSKITLSFWVLSTVAGTYTVLLRNSDPNYAYTFNYTVSADTWKKVTHTISGNSNLVFNTDNGSGLAMFFTLYYGTNYTGTATNETWAAFDSNVQVGDYAQNILATDEAKFEITGVQLEVGSEATSFEHRSFGEELNLCRRYFTVLADGSEKINASICPGAYYTANILFHSVVLPVEMRTAPSMITTNGTNYYQSFSNGSGDHHDAIALGSAGTNRVVEIVAETNVAATAGHATFTRLGGTNASAKCMLDAEL